ncbi:MAG: hypothetical protein WD827_02080, partial [Solirubrobacterales bacterium]
LLAHQPLVGLQQLAPPAGPHRGPHSAAEAMAELGRHAGSRFDPQVVDALVKELSEEAASTPA